MKSLLGALSLLALFVLGACGQQAGMKVELEESTAQLKATKPLISRPAAPPTAARQNGDTSRGVVRATSLVYPNGYPGGDQIYYQLFQEAANLFQYNVNLVFAVRIFTQVYNQFWGWNFPYQTQQFPIGYDQRGTFAFQLYTQSNEVTYRRYAYNAQRWDRSPARTETLAAGQADDEVQLIACLGGAAGASRTLTMIADLASAYGDRTLQQNIDTSGLTSLRNWPTSGTPTTLPAYVQPFQRQFTFGSLVVEILGYGR